GLIASASRMRQTVLGLMGWPRAVVARAAKSEVDKRLNGNLVWQTASQAIALTTAWSRGGKNGLAPPSFLLDQREPATCPTVPPEADGVGMQIHEQPGRDVGQLRGFVEQDGQSCPLVLGTRDRSPTDHTLTLRDEVSGKRRLIKRRGARHDASPFARYLRDSNRTPRE